MEPQHIHDTHHGHGGTEEVRPLVDHRPHEKPAVAPALYAQLLWRGHAEAYELLPGTDEVVKDVLLLVQGTVLVPVECLNSLHRDSTVVRGMPQRTQPEMQSSSARPPSSATQLLEFLV